MKKAIYIALASALITTAAIKAAPAIAQEPAGTETNISLVRTGDLDLSSEVGRRKLELRLARAAREVCGAASDADVEGKNAVRECRDETIAKARAQRDSLIARRNGVIAVAAAR
ncbi:UrcA family protein [Sphingomonas sp.]|uniref:UrcA family protein n=1 Tax=Sphingomonas sp. TaxID=28214 RepID=UPI001840B942|nr:UrcA family protein [Sphingomonas sp.]MBA3511398.1 UrcA family protein [Sphingomonas sp.]